MYTNGAGDESQRKEEDQADTVTSLRKPLVGDEKMTQWTKKAFTTQAQNCLGQSWSVEVVGDP